MHDTVIDRRGFGGGDRQRSRRMLALARPVLLALTVLAATVLAQPAGARGYVGVQLGIPYYGPPVYAVPSPYQYPPPVYVAPPVVIAPPGYVPPGYAPPGYAPPGYASPGYPPPGYPSPGYPPQGYPPTAAPSNAPPGFIAPPGFNAPPGSYAQGGGARAQHCETGTYRCPMERPSSPGASCHCPGNQGQRVYGEVR